MPTRCPKKWGQIRLLAKVNLVLARGITDVAAQDKERMVEVSRRLREIGVKLAISGLKHQVRMLLER